uniref:IPD083Fah n=1 Tax=Coniogramme sp. LL-2018 TaxID=2081517 RepID=A0A3S6ZRB2_9MONI|nr:IPD083Fah [Coniogramme sp. LL-2018]
MAAAAERRLPDYRELYKDLNQISERVRFDQMEFSEVMVIHRMFIRMEELDLGHLEGAEKVKRLYVFADVVEVAEGVSWGLWRNGPLARLPGSIAIVIVCRVLWVSGVLASLGNNSMMLQLPHMKLRVLEITPSKLEIHRVDTSTEAADYPALCIHASVLECSNIRLANDRDRPPFPVRLFGFRPELRDPNLVFSSVPRSVVDHHPIYEFYVFSVIRDVFPRLPLPESVSVQLDSATRGANWYSLQTGSISQVGSVSLNRFPAEEEELEPAFSLMKTKIPAAILTDPNILLTIQTSLLIAELVEVTHPSAETVAAVAKHAEWVNELLLQATSEAAGTSSHEEYLALLFRSQYLIKVRGRTRSLVVPQLQYDVYSNLINRMAQVAESFDQSLRQVKLFILQNKILGSYLLEQNRALAEKEKDMDVFHSELISQSKLELENTIQKMEQLSLQMETQREGMDQAKEDMDAGLRSFQNRRVAEAMFAVISATAAIGLAFVTGGATAPAAVTAAGNAVRAAGQAANALQRVVEILEGLQEVMAMVALIKELVDSLQDIGQLVEAPEMPVLPSEAEWFIFENNVEEVAEGMPTEVSEVSAWKTRCKNVAVLGRAMVSTAAYISQLQYDIKVEVMRQEISKRHSERLLAIQPADLSSYTSLLTHMDMRNTRMLLALIRVLHIQNAALMYHSLSLPTHMNAWPVTMDTVWRMLVQHEHAAILGLLRLGPSFDFMRTYVVKDIPVSLLRDGEDCEFNISVQDHLAFPSTWSRVRIHHLEMKFVQEAHVHQPSTHTGKVYILLQGSRIFHDRNEDDVLHYEAAMPLDLHYAYRLDTGETTLSNLPSNDFIRTFIRTTPFTTWRLRLSASAEENEGLDFPTALTADATTQIAITFYVSAIRRISL